MAGKLGEVFVEILGDADPFSDDFAQALGRAGMEGERELTAALDGISADLSRDLTQAGDEAGAELSRELGEAGDDAAQELLAELSALGQEVGGELGTAGRAAGADFSAGLATATDGISEEIDRELSQVGGNLRGAGAEAGADFARGFEAEAEDLDPDIEAGLTDAAKTAGAAAGIAAGVAMTAGILEGIERESLGDQLAAQLNLTEAESAAAGEVAGSLYADAYGDSLGQVNDAVGGVISTLGGLGEVDVETLSAKALDLATAFDLDVNQAVTTAGTLIRNDLVADADEAFDLITAGLQGVPSQMRDEIFPVMEEYGGFFDTLGFDGEQAMGLIVDASDGGTIAMDKVGDALKELTIRGTDMSTASVEAYDAVGLSAEEMTGSLLAGGEDAQGAFSDIVEGLLAMEDPAERANTAIALFGTPLEDLGTSEIPAFLEGLADMGEGLGDTSGRAEQMGDTLNDNAATKIEGFKRSVEGALASLVEMNGPVGSIATAAAGSVAVLEPLGPAVAGVGLIFRDQLAGMASSMAGGVSAAASWAAGIARNAAASAASMASAAGSMIASGAAWVANVVRQAAAAVASMITTAATFVAQYVRMAAAALAQAARMALSWLIAMGPIALVIAAVVGLVALIVANWDTIVEWTKQAWDWVVGKIVGAWTWIQEATGTAIAAVVAFVVGLKDKAIALVQTLVDFLVKYHPAAVLYRLIAEWAPKVWEVVSGLVGRVVEWFVNLRESVQSRIREMVAAVVSTISGWVEGFVTMILGLKTRVTSGISDLVSGVVTWFTGLPGRIVSALGNMGSLLLSAGGDVIRGLTRGITNAVGNAVQAVRDAGGAILGGIRSALGMNSPSTVFRDEVGAMMMAGVAEGIADRGREAIAEIERFANEAVSAGDMGAVFNEAEMGPVAPPSTMDPRALAPAGGGGGAGGAAGAGVTVVQHITSRNPEAAGRSAIRRLRDLAYLSAPVGPPEQGYDFDERGIRGDR